ncbi:hypothetical protein [Rickettsiales endosymbiont of Trichoplax sp. H2]|uniref:hypothetical protein n=1 Tax=Rickettsiales endosymbiont of Trichoplax sp. H2 TaxID=2021221 RepID=UPI0012B37D34|nr:hypothetical protein [Rickettsiales endosymbiont of Trichoplax sp. H2]MSO14409.1 Carboxypeptidase 1 [Rickettsiales endosymbiont of Trichoplax sp. H2]
MKEYLQLEKLFEEIGLLKTNLSILNWDKEVYMPSNAITERSKQISLISKIMHNMISSYKAQKLCEEVNINKLDNWQLQNFKLMKKKIKLNAVIPSEVIANLSLSVTKTASLWKEAKNKNDYNIVKSEFACLLDNIRKFAKFKSEVINSTPYEALIDEYEPGLKIEFIDKLLNSTFNFVISTISELRTSYPTSISSNYNIEKQQMLIEFILYDLGFDFEKGRIDNSCHPFCGGSASDIRLTTKFNYNDFSQSFYGAIHEAGHANYVNNLPSKWLYQPVGSYLSMGIHESQSLIYENQLGKSKNFINFLFPYLKKIFKKIYFSTRKLYINLLTFYNLPLLE